MLKYHVLHAIASIPSKLSRSAIRRIAACFGGFVWIFFPRRRRLATAAIIKHLHLPPEHAKNIARQSFTENMQSFLEIFQQKQFSLDSYLCHVTRPDLLERIRQETGPVIVTTAHIGSWEFTAALPAEIIPSRKFMVVVRTHKDEALNRLMFELRGGRGVRIVGHRKASSTVLNDLRANIIAVFLVDHNCSRKEAVFLPFLDDIAAINSGPALLALRSKAVVYPAFLLRNGNQGFILDMQEPLQTSMLTGSIAERVDAIAGFYTDAVANVVKRYPEQWFWMHNRWKTRLEEK